MPKTQIASLAALQLPFAGGVIINRKTLAAAQRIAGAASSADGVGRASTQDVLRLAWLFCSEEVQGNAAGEPGGLTRKHQETLSVATVAAVSPVVQMSLLLCRMILYCVYI